jgi:hypothetical protein
MPPAARDTSVGPESRNGARFWISAAAGWALIAWGVRGALHYRRDTRPLDLARFFVAGAVIHDLIFAPLVLGAGVALGRLVPPRWRSYVQGALLVSGLLALFTYPEVRGYAHVLHNPTSLPHNYAANLLVVIAAVWAVAAVMATFAAIRSRHGRRN